MDAPGLKILLFSSLLCECQPSPPARNGNPEPSLNLLCLFAKGVGEKPRSSGFLKVYEFTTMKTTELLLHFPQLHLSFSKPSSVSSLTAMRETALLSHAAPDCAGYPRNIHPHKLSRIQTNSCQDRVGKYHFSRKQSYGHVTSLLLLLCWRLWPGRIRCILEIHNHVVAGNSSFLAFDCLILRTFRLSSDPSFLCPSVLKLLGSSGTCKKLPMHN